MCRLLVLLSIFLLSGGCASTYWTERLYEQSAPTRLDRGGKAYVALPKPGSYKLQEYKRSGKMTADAITCALADYVAEATVGEHTQDYDSALVSARRCGAKLLVFPIIEHWEDRVTEHSGIPDRIFIKILVTNVVSGERIDSVEISGKSKVFTFGGDHPQDLLNKPVHEYFKSLFKKPGVNSLR